MCFEGAHSVSFGTGSRVRSASRKVIWPLNHPVLCCSVEVMVDFLMLITQDQSIYSTLKHNRRRIPRFIIDLWRIMFMSVLLIEYCHREAERYRTSAERLARGTECQTAHIPGALLTVSVCLPVCLSFSLPVTVCLPFCAPSSYCLSLFLLLSVSLPVTVCLSFCAPFRLC
jgi:hypothetical protein